MCVFEVRFKVQTYSCGGCEFGSLMAPGPGRRVSGGGGFLAFLPTGVALMLQFTKMQFTQDKTPRLTQSQFSISGTMYVVIYFSTSQSNGLKGMISA